MGHIEEKADIMVTSESEAAAEPSPVKHQEIVEAENPKSKPRAKSSNQEMAANNLSSPIHETIPNRNYMRSTATSRQRHIEVVIAEDPLTKWKTVHQELKETVDSRSSELEFMHNQTTNNRTTLQISEKTVQKENCVRSQSSTLDSKFTLSLD